MPARRPLRDEEPFATIRAHPRRFGWGIPLVLAVSLGAAIPLAGTRLSLAVAVQLFLQTAGLLWLYVPPARRRWREERRAAEGREAGGPAPGETPARGAAGEQALVTPEEAGKEPGEA